tara:strand:+ start:51 stop:206 length:156 start_codon:yes stop_codon:yes gene_type:complete
MQPPIKLVFNAIASELNNKTCVMHTSEVGFIYVNFFKILLLPTGIVLGDSE